jgi:hypothetical protein
MRRLLLGLGVAAALALTGCNTDHKSGTAPVRLPSTPCGTNTGLGCAPQSRRVDLARPTFSNPTDVNNPFFPITRLKSVVLMGHVNGKPFRTETTLLPGTRSVFWDGRNVPVVVSQYTAYLDGRLTEVAIDRYAQADDGAVWYFGEDVFDYENGAVAVTEGTWLAGKEGPAAMIMPGHPKAGDVFRLENIPGIVFEEVEVKSVGETVAGPRGPVRGALLAEELHSDGSYDHKIYAPGYGEFRTTGGGDLEALALAAPTDAVAGRAPAELDSLARSAVGILESARIKDWETASATLQRMRDDWKVLSAGNPPRMVARSLSRALTVLARAVKAREVERITQAAIDVWQPVLDLELLHRPAAQVNADRFVLWTQQLRVDAAAKSLAGVTGDVAVLEWIRDRLVQLLDPTGRREIDSRLRDLRTAVDARNLPAAADHAARLAARMRVLSSP